MQRSVLVTGSSRGIGAAIATQLAASGFEVVLHCRSQWDAAEAVRSAIESAGGSARILKFDIGERERTAEVLLADVEAHGAYYDVVQCRRHRRQCISLSDFRRLG